MAQLGNEALLHQLRVLFVAQKYEHLSDADLAQRVAGGGDEAAFTAVVRRHGAMVLKVCRHVLRRDAEADDAFQATFLVFGRKAGSIRRHTSLGGWLHGVAFRCAMDLKKSANRRRRLEQAALSDRAPESPAASAGLRELQALLDEEVARLADSYRTAFVICCVEGKSRAEAAQSLGWKEGTLASRLAKARAILQKRLSARGVTLSAALSAAALSPAAAISAGLAQRTVAAGLAFACGDATAISNQTLAIVKGVLQGMFIAKLKWGSFALLAASFAMTTAASQIQPTDDGGKESKNAPQVLPAAAQVENAIPAKDDGTDAFGDPLPPGALMRLGTTRWRPSGNISHLAFSPDAKRMVSWHEEHYTTAALTLWDVATGREVRRLELPGLRIGRLSLLPDGRGIGLVFTSEGPVLWDFTDMAFALTHKVGVGGTTGVVKLAPGALGDTERDGGFALSPDGKSLAAGKTGDLPNKQRDLVVWDVVTQKKLSELPAPRRLGVLPSNCQSLYYTPDSRKIVAFCQPGEAEPKDKKYLAVVLDAATGKEIRRFTTAAPMSQGSTVALSPKYMALGMEDEQGTILLWDLEKDQDRRLQSGHGKRNNYSGYGVSALTFTDDGATLITAGRDGNLRIWNVATLAKRLTIADANSSWIEHVAATPDGKRVACAGQGGIIRHFDGAAGKEIDADFGNRDRITGVQISPDGAHAVTVGADRRIEFWDLNARRKTQSRTVAETGSWPDVAMAPDGRTVVVGSAKQLTAWNIATGQEHKLPLPSADFKPGAVSRGADGKSLLIHRANWVSLVDWPAATVRRTLTLPEPDKKPGEAHGDAVALSPDGRWLATLSHRYWYREERGLRFGYGDDGVLDLWNAVSGERVHRLAGGGSIGRTVLFTADGDLLFDGGGKLHPRGSAADADLKGQFHLVDPLTGQLKQSFEEAPRLPGTSHRYNSAIGLTADGRTVICTGNDGVIHLYETATGKIRRSLARHRDFIHKIAVTTDGRRLLTASADLTALLWDISLAGAAPKKTAAPTAAEQAKLWEQLSDSNAKVAYEAMATFAAHPPAAVAAIRSGIKPAPPGPPDATLDRLVAELGDDKFVVRDRAAKELNSLGEAAAPGMRARLAQGPPLETHRRLAQFLERFDPATLTSVHLRQLRALEILEQINETESRALLATLAQGARDARLTRASAAALSRLSGKSQ